MALKYLFICMAFGGMAVSAEEATVFEEDFLAFPVGDDALVGVGGWVGNGVGEGVHGIDDLSEAFGNSGFIGYFPATGSPPSEVTTRVGHPLGYDPLAEGTPDVIIAAVLGIQDSTNGEGDNFFVSIFNADGQNIASVNFDNSGESPEVFRFDGVDFFATGASFFYDSFVEFTAEIDFEKNEWSAYLGEVPLFIDAPFANREAPRDLGFLFFEWEVFNRDPIEPGTNWMLFDEIEVLVEAPSFTMPTPLADGLRYFTEPAYSYQVEHSEDLSTWKSDLEGSAKAAGEPAGTVIFSDPTAPAGGRRFYRVVRKLAP